MNIDKLRKLENTIGQKDFELANRGKSNLWNTVGWVFQVLNILICVMGLASLMAGAFGAFAGSVYVYLGGSAVILIAWELLKRTTVNEAVIAVMKTKEGIKTSMAGTLILAMLLVAGSGFFAVTGIREVTDKSHEIETVAEANTTAVSDSISNVYNQKTARLEEQMAYYYDNAKAKERTLTKLESKQIANLEGQLEKTKTELNDKLQGIEAKKDKVTSSKKEQVGSSVVKFLLITITIELFIIVSLLIVSTIDYKTYKQKIDSPEFKKFVLYDELLDIYFNNGKFREGSECISQSKFENLVKLKGHDLSKADFTNFNSFLASKDITDTKGSKKNFAKGYDEAKRELKLYFNFS